MGFLPNSISLDDPDFFKKINSQRPDVFNQEKMAKNIEQEYKTRESELSPKPLEEQV